MSESSQLVAVLLKAKNPARSSDHYGPISNIKVWRRNFHHAPGWCQLMRARLPCNLKGFKTKAPSYSHRLVQPVADSFASQTETGKLPQLGKSIVNKVQRKRFLAPTLLTWLQLNLMKGKPLIVVPPQKARSSLWWSFSHFYEARFITNGSKLWKPCGTTASPPKIESLPRKIVTLKSAITVKEDYRRSYVKTLTL